MQPMTIIGRRHERHNIKSSVSPAFITAPAREGGSVITSIANYAERNSKIYLNLNKDLPLI